MKILFHLVKHRMVGNMIPIYCRITIDGKRSELATGSMIQEYNWNQDMQLSKDSSVNSILIKLKESIESIYASKVSSGYNVTSKMIKLAVMNRPGSNKMTLSTLIDKYVAHKINISSISEETVKKYGYLRTKLEPMDINVKDIDRKYIFNLHNYLLSNGQANNTANKSLRLLSAILSFGVISGFVESNAMVGYKLKMKKKEIVYLTDDELKKIEKSNLDSRLAVIRDIFLFQCYTGFEYSRVCDVRVGDISEGVDGNLWLYTTRKKTKTSSSIPVLPKTLSLINKYVDLDHDIKSKKIFPKRSNQKMNAYLKEIGIISGIKKKLTTHLSRHTFATTICLSNGISMESTSAMLGHKSIKTTQSAYGIVLEERLSKEVASLRSRYL